MSPVSLPAMVERSSSGRVAGTACDDGSMHHSERDLRELTSGAVVNDGTLVACSCSVSHREIPIYYMCVRIRSHFRFFTYKLNLGLDFVVPSVGQLVR